MSELNLRVGMQSRMGTTLLWNKTALTDEQAKQYQVFARLVKEGVPGEWVQPRTVRPPLTGNLASIVNDQTDFIMLPHVVTEPFNERTTFDVKIDFGGPENLRSVVIRVDPYGQHTQFVKPRRVDMGPDKPPVYAHRVYVEDVSDTAADRIAQALKRQTGK